MRSSSPPPERPDGEQASAGGRGKFILFVVLLASMAAVVAATDAGRFFERERVEALMAGEGRLVTAALFIGLYTIGTVVTVPGTILSLLGGALFGVWLGTGLVVIGATLGASLAFMVARYLAREFVARRFGKVHWIERIDRGIVEEGIWFVLFIRLVPLFPFNWINYAAGLTQVRFRDFFVGTAIGIIPGSFVYVNVAARTADAVAQGVVTPELAAALGLLGLLALVPILYRRMTHRGKE